MADAPKSRSNKAAGKSTAHAAVSRRAELRKAIPKSEARWWRKALGRPQLMASLPIAIALAIVAGALTAWMRELPLVAPGRIMTDTRLVRSEFRVEDTAAVETKRRNARQNTPRVYNADQSAFDEIESALLRLPTALADAKSLDDVAPELRKTYQLTDEELTALRTQAVAGDASQAWRTRVEALVGQLHAMPMLDNEAFQLEQTTGSRQWIEVRAAGGKPARLLKGRIVNLQSAQLTTTLRQAALAAGFDEPVASMIAGYLARNARPTFLFDADATTKAQDADADAVEPEYITHPAGQVIYRRGEKLSTDALAMLNAERAAWVQGASTPALWAPRIGAALESLLLTIGLWLYIAAFCRRIRRNPLRILTVAALLAGGLALAGVIASESPAFLPLAASAPTVFVTAILVIAYDRATALAIGTLHGALVVIALGQPMAMFLPALAGVIAVAWRLDDVRTRNDLVRAGLTAGLSMAVTLVAVALLDRPAGPGLWREIVVDASWQLGVGVGVGVVMGAILPIIERVFGVITGMTLIELRDPKQPLLRQLQQRAPGTYNHCIAVANIAETAAEAVGADSLHVYVGALYHDIGKMNKPDYFVENQTGDFNRHSSITPAMSLLVIIGHVKDGVELAREYNLPRSLHHYIESHHGTTLVEYFHHEALQQAKASGEEPPAESDYRYPGPKPRTKEAAILMLADSVESATRALKEPAPARIDALVRDIAQRRLEDGQFDNCDMTLRELQTIEASIIKSVTSIYHARIAYPGDARSEPKPPPPSAPAAQADSPHNEPPIAKTISQSA